MDADRPARPCCSSDFLDPKAPAAIMAALGGQADLVLSDMAAPTTGHAATDHLRIVALAEAAFDFAERNPGAGRRFRRQGVPGRRRRRSARRLEARFHRVRHAKPPASRAESAEIYVVATGLPRRRIARSDARCRQG